MVTEDYVSFETAKLLKEKGVELDLKGEAYAYLIEYLTNEFYNLAYNAPKQKEELNKPR